MICANKKCKDYDVDSWSTSCKILGMHDNMRMLCKDFVSLQTSEVSLSKSRGLLKCKCDKGTKCIMEIVAAQNFGGIHAGGPLYTCGVFKYCPLCGGELTR